MKDQKLSTGCFSIRQIEFSFLWNQMFAVTKIGWALNIRFQNSCNLKHYKVCLARWFPMAAIFVQDYLSGWLLRLEWFRLEWFCYVRLMPHTKRYLRDARPKVIILQILFLIHLGYSFNNIVMILLSPRPLSPFLGGIPLLGRDIMNEHWTIQPHDKWPP